MQFVIFSMSKRLLDTFLYIPYGNATIYEKSLFALTILRVPPDLPKCQHFKCFAFRKVRLNSIKIKLNSIFNNTCTNVYSLHETVSSNTSFPGLSSLTH